MKKVKILSSYYEESLELDVNDFLASHKDITDIQFQASVSGSIRLYAVMVTYEE